MNDLNSTINKTREKYREIFMRSIQIIEQRIYDIKPNDVHGDIFKKYPHDSDGEKWQKVVLNLLTNDISKDILKKRNEILAYRKQFCCLGCAVCCNLACTEFSPEELNEKAKNGDNFASQFTSIFIPYKNRFEAEKIYPEYPDMLKEKDKVYFYHCPKLSKDNKCSDYINRPNICKTFPDNPLAILPKSCGFYQWKQEVEPTALMLHAFIEIINYYKSKIPIDKD